MDEKRKLDDFTYLEIVKRKNYRLDLKTDKNNSVRMPILCKCRYDFVIFIYVYGWNYPN